MISQALPNGEEIPISCASRTLAPSELNYAKIKREALGILFGVKGFQNYLYGRGFTWIADHKPLTVILNAYSAIPSFTALRMQRWALTRVPCLAFLVRHLKEMLRRTLQLLVPSMESLPNLGEHIATETRRDTTLARVLDYALKG